MPMRIHEEDGQDEPELDHALTARAVTISKPHHWRPCETLKETWLVIVQVPLVVRKG